MSLTDLRFFEFGEFRLDPLLRVLRRGQETVSVTPKAFDLLLLLVRSGGRVLTKEEIMKAVWTGSFVEESNLTQTIFVLRKALGESPDQRFILTVQSRGYRFVTEVQEVKRETTREAQGQVTNPTGQPGFVKPSAGRRIWPIILGVLLLLGIATGIYLRMSHRDRSGGRERKLRDSAPLVCRTSHVAWAL
jgi:DNA-binding winged helix-turn-helix (wHTH) protein